MRVEIVDMDGKVLLDKENRQALAIGTMMSVVGDIVMGGKRYIVEDSLYNMDDNKIQIQVSAPYESGDKSE